MPIYNLPVVAVSSASTPRVVALGDSNTAGGSGWGTSWFERFCWRAKGKVRKVFNAGVSGNTTAQMLSRVSTDVLAWRPHVCFVMAGTNDVNQNVPLATTQANIAAIASAIVGAGIQPVFLLPYPGTYASDGNGTTGQKQARMALLVAWLVQWCSANGYECIDTHTPLVLAAGGANTTYFTNESGVYIHTNAAGADLVATTVLNATSFRAPGVVPLAQSDLTGAHNLIGNAVSMTDTDLNGFPDGWITAGGTGGTPSRITGDADYGNGLQVVLASASAYVSAYTVSTGFAVGDVLLVGGAFKATDTGSLSINFGVRFVGPNTNALLMSSFAGGLSDAVVIGDYTVGNPSSVPSRITVPANTTSISYRFYCSGNGTVQFFRPVLINLTQLGIS